MPYLIRRTPSVGSEFSKYSEEYTANDGGMGMNDKKGGLSRRRFIQGAGAAAATAGIAQAELPMRRQQRRQYPAVPAAGQTEAASQFAPYHVR